MTLYGPTFGRTDILQGAVERPGSPAPLPPVVSEPPPVVAPPAAPPPSPQRQESLRFEAQQADYRDLVREYDQAKRKYDEDVARQDRLLREGRAAEAAASQAELAGVIERTSGQARTNKVVRDDIGLGSLIQLMDMANRGSRNFDIVPGKRSFRPFQALDNQGRHEVAVLNLAAAEALQKGNTTEAVILKSRAEVLDFIRPRGAVDVALLVTPVRLGRAIKPGTAAGATKAIETATVHKAGEAQGLAKALAAREGVSAEAVYGSRVTLSATGAATAGETYLAELKQLIQASPKGARLTVSAGASPVELGAARRIGQAVKAEGRKPGALELNVDRPLSGTEVDAVIESVRNSGFRQVNIRASTPFDPVALKWQLLKQADGKVPPLAEFRRSKQASKPIETLWRRTKAKGDPRQGVAATFGEAPRQAVPSAVAQVKAAEKGEKVYTGRLKQLEQRIGHSAAAGAATFDFATPVATGPLRQRVKVQYLRRGEPDLKAPREARIAFEAPPPARGSGRAAPARPAPASGTGGGGRGGVAVAEREATAVRAEVQAAEAEGLRVRQQAFEEISAPVRRRSGRVVVPRPGELPQGTPARLPGPGPQPGPGPTPQRPPQPARAPQPAPVAEPVGEAVRIRTPTRTETGRQTETGRRPKVRPDGGPDIRRYDAPKGERYVEQVVYGQGIVERRHNLRTDRHEVGRDLSPYVTNRPRERQPEDTLVIERFTATKTQPVVTDEKGLTVARIDPDRQTIIFSRRKVRLN